jgi:transglutaminase-like putative cysteine protease
MRFEVDHKTLFSYSEPATLGPHTIRLRPRCDAAQDVRAFELEIDPVPEGRFDFTDQDGNHVTRVWWVGPTESLRVRTTWTVETLRSNPFDFVVFDPQARRVPASYPGAEREALSAYLAAAPPPESLLAEFAGDLVREAGGEIAPFLSALAGRIRERVEHETRDHGDPLPSEVTLGQGRGACRDAAVVFVDACRVVGIAARFVSGYQEGLPEDGAGAVPSGSNGLAPPDERALHAWAEAYVPEAGWRGFDPSQGLAVADRHVALAAAATPKDAAPTEGSFGPAGVRARLDARLDVRVHRS